MATVGNLFVNVGASTRGLEQGLQRSQQAVKKFAQDANAAARNIASAIPGVGAMFDRMEQLGGLGKNMAAMWDAFNGGAKEAADRMKRLAAAQQELASLKGTRKNIGLARSMLAKEGFDPNKAASQLKIADTSSARAEVTAAINAQREAVQRLAGAEAFRAKLAKGRDPFTGQILSAANKAKMLEAATSDIAKAQEKLTAATARTTAAQKTLGAVMDSNRKKEAVRGKLKGMGIDLGKGQSALRLPSLAEAQERLAALRKEAADAASGFKVFGLSITKALGPVGLLGAALAAATAGALAFTISQVKAMDALQDQALAAGMGVEAFQRLNAMYHEVGVAAGVVEMASARLGIKLQEAVDGGEDAQFAFSRLGLDFKDLAASTPDVALEKVIGRIRELGSSRERVAALKATFGKSGIGLAAAVNATSESLAEAANNARKLTIPASVVNSMAAVNDRFEAARKSLTNLGVYFASTFAPVLDSLAKSMMEMFATDVGAWVGAFQSVSVVLAVVYDIVAGIVNVMAVVVNLAQALGGIINTVLLGAFGAVLKIVQWIVKGVEWLTNSASTLSEGIGDAASVAFSAAGHAAEAAGEDAAEALSRAADALKPDATVAVWRGIAAGWQSTKESIQGSPLHLKAEIDGASMKKVEADLQQLRDKVQKATIGEDAADLMSFRGKGATDAQAAEYQALQQQLRVLEQQQAAHETIADLNDQIAKSTMTAAQYAEYEAVTKKGMSLQDAATVASLTKQLELTQAQAQAREEVASTLADLQQKVDQLGQSELEILRTKMMQNGATAEQIAQAEQLQAILEQAKVDDALQSHFDALENRLLEAQGAEEEILRRQLENMGLAGDALNDALARTMDIEAQITEAERLKANQESVAGTLEDLTNQLDKMRLGDIGYMVKQLRSKGASEADISRAVSMQQEIDRLSGKATTAAKGGEEAAKGVSESIETAIGSMKLGAVVSGDPTQRSMLSETEQQTGYLADISTTITNMARGSGGLMAAQEGTAIATTATVDAVGIAKQENDTVMAIREGNEILRQIADNTRAFAGVLT